MCIFTTWYQKITGIINLSWWQTIQLNYEQEIPGDNRLGNDCQ